LAQRTERIRDTYDYALQIFTIYALTYLHISALAKGLLMS